MRNTFDLTRVVEKLERLRRRRSACDRRGAQQALDVACLENRILFSAAPLDPAMMDIDMAEVDAMDLQADEEFMQATADALAVGDGNRLEEGLVLTPELIGEQVSLEDAANLMELLQDHDPEQLLGDGLQDSLLQPEDVPEDHFDPFGNEYHALTDLPVLQADDSALIDATTTAFAISTADTFFLNSNPGASHNIYLDFNGHVTSGTYWNDSFNNGQDIITPAFDFDGDTSFFSEAEHERIQYIWQRVSEDFMPFDVNVTTEDPGFGGLSNSGGGDVDWGTRIVVGGSSYDWYGGGAGGVAYVGSFNWSNDTPAFVFEEQLGNGHEKYVAEATSHEIGHTLGLGHDGSSTSSYYSGHGSGDTGWAPIMGSGYYKNLTQWSSGEYSGANNTQDDLATITSDNGFGYRLDDHGDSDGMASLLSFSDSAVSGSGIIEQNTDVDVFSFTTAGGSLDLQINPFERGPNLDVLAELYDSASNLIVASNPLDFLSATINATVTAGQYFLHVTGTGYGDPFDVGYSDYGSLGQYTIDGTVTPSSGDSVAITATSASQLEGNSGSTSLLFTVSRSGDLSDSTTVDYSVTGSGANPAEASDFVGGTLPAGTVMFAPGETSKTISIDVAGDETIESDENFAVTLSNPNGDTQITNDQAFSTILNDDVLDTTDSISIAATDAMKAEGDSGSSLFTFTVTRTGYTGDSTSVNYVVSGSGSEAASASDFTGNTLPGGSIVFDVGETSKTISIDVAGDVDVEGDEGFTVTLSNPSGDTQITGDQGVATILNDDSTAATAGITVTPVSGLSTNEAGATASFTVVLDSQPNADVIVQVASLDTTEGSVDTGSLTFTAADWNVARTVTVHGVDDAVRDGNVSYAIRLAAAESGDGSYHGLDPDDVELTNQDNEKGGPKTGGGGGKGGGKGGPKKADLPNDFQASSLTTEATAGDEDSDSPGEKRSIDALVREYARDQAHGKVAALDFAIGEAHGAQWKTDFATAGLGFYNSSEEHQPGLLGSALRSLYGRGSQDEGATE